MPTCTSVKFVIYIYYDLEMIYNAYIGNFRGSDWQDWELGSDLDLDLDLDLELRCWYNYIIVVKYAVVATH